MYTITVLYYIISYYIISYHIISYHIILYHIISYYIILYHIIYHTISYYIMLYNIILHYIIVYYIISYGYIYIYTYDAISVVDSQSFTVILHHTIGFRHFLQGSHPLSKGGSSMTSGRAFIVCSWGYFVFSDGCPVFGLSMNLLWGSLKFARSHYPCWLSFVNHDSRLYHILVLMRPTFAPFGAVLVGKVNEASLRANPTAFGPTAWVIGNQG